MLYFFLYNNVTSIVRYFSVISAPLDQGPHEVQSQLVPKFSHAFFLSTHLWVFAKHLINLCQIHHFWQKFAFFEKSVIVKVAFFVISFEFCSNLSCYILPKFAIFSNICHPCKNLYLPTGHFSPSHLASQSLLLAKFAIFAKFVIFVKIANSQLA